MVREEVPRLHKQPRIWLEVTEAFRNESQKPRKGINDVCSIHFYLYFQINIHGFRSDYDLGPQM
ncbi:hypothetical protein D3C79_780730 [compost metagenome]